MVLLSLYILVQGLVEHTDSTNLHKILIDEFEEGDPRLLYTIIEPGDKFLKRKGRKHWISQHTLIRAIIVVKLFSLFQEEVMAGEMMLGHSISYVMQMYYCYMLKL